MKSCDVPAGSSVKPTDHNKKKPTDHNQKLKRDLYKYLIQDDMSLESGIVNVLVYHMIGVEIGDTEKLFKSNFGFNLQSYSYSDEKNKGKIIFNLPQLSLENLEKYLAFLGVARKDYVIYSPLALNPQFVFETLLPKFKAYYEQLKAEHSPILAQYKIKSKFLLESSAISTIREYAGQAITEIQPKDTDETYEISDELKPIIKCMMVLNSLARDTKIILFYYKDIIQMYGELEGYIQALIASGVKETLVSRLKLTLEGVKLFQRYNRCPAVLSNKHFMKEMNGKPPVF